MPWDYANQTWTPHLPEQHVLISGVNRLEAIAWIKARQPLYRITLINPTLEDAYKLAAAEIHAIELFCVLRKRCNTYWMTGLLPISLLV